MSEDAAESRKLSPGDPVTVQFARSGQQKLTLGGTYETNQLIGDYLVDASKAADFSTQRNIAGLVGLDDGAECRHGPRRAGLRAEGVPERRGARPVGVRRAGARARSTWSCSIINLLLGFSVLIALLGVINTLALSVIERTRELGLLRAVGMARKQVKRMIRVESVLICILRWAARPRRGLDLRRRSAASAEGRGSLRAELPGRDRWWSTCCRSALAGVIAAALPARRASRLNVLQAIATE